MNILFRGIKNSISQILKGFFLLLLSLVLARYLGPSSFGAYSVAIAIALQFWSLLDMGLQRAFFFFSSSENQSKSFFLLFLLIIFFQALFGTSGFIIFNKFLKNSDEFLFFSDFFVSFLIFFNVFCQKSILNTATLLSDLKRVSWKGNGIEALCYMCHLIFILYFFINREFSQEILMVFLTFQSLLNVLFSIYLIQKFFPEINFKKYSSLGREFLKVWNYCKPLIPYTILGSIIVSLEQLILITFGGNQNAAFYAVVARFALISSIITSGFVNILSREISKLKNEENLKRINNLIKSSSELVFLISSFLAIFLGINSKELIYILYGESYEEASITFFIYSIYIPIQVTGSLVAIFYYALAMTRSYSLIQSISQIIGLVIFLVSILFLMDKDNPRADIFLAMKFLFVYLFAHSYCYINCLQKNEALKSIIKMLLIYILLSFGAFISKSLMQIYYLNFSNDITNLFLHGIIYTTVIIAVFYIFDNLSNGKLVKKNFHVLLQRDLY